MYQCALNLIRLAVLSCLVGGVSAIAGIAGVSADEARVNEGRMLVRQHCMRCHVVGDMNPFGGIGMTPSFGAIKSLADWQTRFEIFWTLLPHPSVVQVEGISPPRPEQAPASLKQIVLNQAQVDAIRAFVHTLKAKDLGAPISYK